MALVSDEHVVQLYGESQWMKAELGNAYLIVARAAIDFLLRQRPHAVLKKSGGDHNDEQKSQDNPRDSNPDFPQLSHPWHDTLQSEPPRLRTMSAVRSVSLHSAQQRVGARCRPRCYS